MRRLLSYPNTRVLLNLIHSKLFYFLKTNPTVVWENERIISFFFNGKRIRIIFFKSQLFILFSFLSHRDRTNSNSKTLLLLSNPLYLRRPPSPKDSAAVSSDKGHLYFGWFRTDLKCRSFLWISVSNFQTNIDGSLNLFKATKIFMWSSVQPTNCSWTEWRN